MSRYSTRYDSSNSYKSGLDPGNLGSYRSSNLSTYSGGLGHSSSRSDRFGSSSSSYSSGPSTSSSSRLHGSYSSTRSSVVDSVPLPRSTSFGRSEVLSSSTPRDPVDKGSYSSSLSRTSSLPTSTDEPRSGRYSSRGSALTSNHSLDTGTDAAAERRLRLAQRRRQREEGAGGSETGSDNSKEPSLERSSSLRRDSDSDSGLPGSGQLSRRWAGRRMRESSLTEESEGKDSSPDVPETGVRRARNLRGASGSSEDSTTALAPASSLDSVPPSDEDAAFQRSSEARRSRRQQRLEEASRQASGSLDEGTAKEAEASTRPWRRRLQEQGITTATDDTQSSRRRSRDGEAVLTDSTLSSSRRRSQDLEQENGSRRRSQDMTQEGVSRRRSLRGAGGEGSAEEAAKLADAVASEVETRTERIARYKEERRKQLAHIASITSPAGSEEKESEALPSLFTAAKREKEGSPSDSAGQTASETEESGGGGALTLSSRLRAMRTGSEEMLKDSDIADGVRARDSAVRPEMPAGKVTDVKTRSAERDKADKSSSAQSSTLPDKTATTSRKSPSPASTRKPLTTSTESVTTRRPSAGSREPSPKKMSVSSVSSDKPGRRTSDSSTDSRAGRKPSDSSADSRAIRKPSDGSLETRKSKSPSPVSSRLLAATRSSAAKEAVTAGKGSPSPRSSPSPRGSPAPSDRTSVSKPATGTVSSRGPPRIKQSLMPERGAKDTAGPGVGKEETREEQALSKSTVRLFKGAEKASDKVAARESPEKTGTAAAPKLSSSSFSAASSTRSTDRDSGFGSSRLSSSSFSSNRSTDKDTYTVPPVKPPRLQRTAHVDVSSSSSREGSEEKQITGSQAASSVNRTSALPSRATTSGSQQAKTQGATDSSRTQAGERKLSSSSRKEEPTVPKDLPLSQRLAAIRRASSKEEDEQGKSPADRKDSKTKVPRNGVLGETASSSGSMGAGLDDILAKNAEFLSSDEEAGAGQPGKGKGKGERRQLRAEEEPRLRRSLRKKFLHKSGSSSRDSPARESKETEAETDITVTLPTSDVKETLTSHVAAKSDVSAKEKDDAKKGVPEALQGEREGSKEGTPDSDSVFETAPSTPRVDNTHSRVRPEDKTGLRKSALNKAADSLSHRGRDQGKEEGEKEVSDIRNRFAGGLSSNEKSKSDKPDKASGLTRHHSRGKDFSQLLQKFSSNSEASSSERSDSDSGHRLTTLRRGDTGHSSSDDAQLDGSRRTPERSHSLRVARSAAAASPKESKEKGVERSSSFKSDFMKKRFSPVPQDDKPSAELSAVLSRRQEEVQKQQEEEVESDKRGDRRQARAEKFKAASVEEVIADNEVAAVLKARRKETDSKAEAADPGFTTIEQSLDTLARVTHELGEDKEPSPETERLKPVPRSEPAAASKRKTSKESIKEAEQLISDVETRISSSLHLSDKDTPSKTISEPCKKETTKTVSESCKKETAKTVSAKDDKVSVQSSKEKKPSKEPSDKAEKVGSKDSDKDTTFTINTSAFSPVRSPERESSIESTTSSSSSLRRAESLKEQSSISRSESFERRKGILKRTPSASKSDRPVIDPQLARIMEQRRLKELEMEEAKEEEEEEEEAKKRGVGRLRARSAAEEIEESVRVMRESHQGDVEHQEEEALLTISVSERISRMQTLATTTEERHVPKPRSGTTTPKRAWSGGATPRKQISVDEGVAEVIPEETTTTTTISGTTTTQDEVSSTQLIARLNSLWTKSKDFEDRRHKFQKRQRDDWRTRTQPVTLEEIQQADGLESVSTFRAEVRRKASQNIFDQLKNQDNSKAKHPLPTKDIEFPQHLTPEKRAGPTGRRGRLQRHNTLPVTAEELNAIPEGELMEPVQLRERDTDDMWKRDSRTDSGILSCSDLESLGSDSLRSLCLDMDLSDNDPSRLSVSSKASLFRLMDEKAKVEREKEKCASGAKRYIDRKKRERCRTMPVTEDEVKTAASMADSENKKTAQVKIAQPEVVNRPKSPSGNGESEEQQEEEEEDQLTKLTLAEKVKLFSQKQKEEAEAATTKPPTRSDAPVRRRGRKLQPSRFQTQPVTPEELEKASKISPLAMSLVKPPDPELLAGMKLKDQQELMMMHAEATLSQCSSRAGSRPSSQPGSRRSSFTTPETLQSGGEVEGSEKSSLTTTTTTTTSTTTPSRGRHTGSQNELTRSDSEPRGILKKIKSTESVPTDPVSSKPISTTTTTTTTTTKDKTTTSSTKSTESLVSSSVKDTGVKDTTIGERDATRGVKETSTSLKDSSVKDSEEDTEGDRASPVAELILPVLEAEVDVTSTTFFLTDDDIGGESTTDPVTGEGEKEEEQDVTPRSRDSKRRSRFADRKGQAERYLTQPSPQFTPSEKSPPPKRKYEGRHMTQPITADEMTEAESATTPVSKVAGGSISERLNQLKTSGEENWKRKVMKDGDTPLSAVDVKLREKKGLAAVRPTSISDRLCKLDRSAETWKERVEETDAKHFTVANKLSKSSTVFVSESPLVAKIKASSKKDLTGLDDSSNTSSPVTSPSTPTKEFLPKVPLPKEIIADPVAVKEAAETKSKEEQKAVGNGVEEGEKPVRVEVPSLDHEQIEEFFSIKEITEISDKVEMDIDDFNNIFVEANEILQSVKKIRPTRKTKARSRNPLKTVSQFVEIQTEYTQVNTGAAENQLRKMKTDALKRDAGLAVEALAALSSKENFSNVALRKTEQSSSHPALALQQNPFSDLMLLHVKGRRNIQTRLVEPSGKSINAGDCYLLVTPDKVIVWVGEYSNIIEKAKAAEIATFIQQKKNMGYKGVAGAQTVDQAKDHLGAGKPFWNALSGDKQCQACGPDEEDELYENAIIKTNMVYKFTDGALKPFEEYWGATPRHEMLNKKEVLVFDFGTEFYVWQGVSVSLEKRKQSMALAQKLWDKGYDYSECAVNPMGPLRSDDDDSIPLKASKRPEWAIFGKVNQNMETILFREKFADWPDNSRLIGVKEVKATEQKIDLADIKAYDAKKMIPLNDAPVSLKLDGSHVGRGKKWQEDMQGFIKEQDILTLGVRVWHVMEYDHYEVPETSYGQFHRGDTYVVRWQYMITNAGLKSLKGAAARQSLTGRERCAYFFWQGQDSTVNEKGASALMTVELDEERGPQVRVVQGKEPPCFLNLFEGSMVLHIGKREDSTTNTAGPWRMYSVRGDKAGEVCLLEIPVSISNLRSRSSLVLLNTRTGVAYVWHGVKSPKQVRQLAVAAVKSLKEKRPLELDLHKDAHIIITEVEEGEEKSEIWTALDSRNRSLYHSLLKDGARYDYTPRLFYMTSVSMVFEVTEQMNPARLPGVTTPFPFFQTDLYNAPQPALFLMDVGKCVYLWQGWWPVGDEDVENVHTGSAAARFNIDRRCAMETTLNYSKEQGSEAYLVCAGVEPLEFQNLFPYWEPDATVCSLALQEGKKDGWCERVEDVYTKLTQARYTFEELQERPLPEGVDPLKLETYLADEEFEEVLEMSREEFYQLPSWKQKQTKQSLGLY
ncbi:platelet binding protein GspB-like isoform X2 [Littorina saxatilis]|uniref:platelet binding protein GspB-like isoform X2 n=1 Tax=Littorina saxatilis TaxID=31220 RepID=UPI0038B5167A